jgi:hypothetical protein
VKTLHTPVTAQPHLLALRLDGQTGRSSASTAAWIAALETIAFWPVGQVVRPVLERRTFRVGPRGALRSVVLLALHDPLAILTDAEAKAELTELGRPLVQALGLAPLRERDARTALAAVPRHAVALAQLDAVSAERAVVVDTLGATLLDGLAALHGPVALSVAVAPADADDELEAVASGPRVRFGLRLAAHLPLPLTLRARAQALCLHDAAGDAAWTASDEADGHVSVALRRAAVERAATAPATLPSAAFLLSMPVPTGRDRQRSVGRAFEGPLPPDGVVLGRVPRPSGRRAALRLPWEARRHHTLVIGASGCGKSTTLLRIAIDDVSAGRGLVVIDPHGDTCDAIADVVAPLRPVVRIDPRRADSAPLDLLHPEPARAAANIQAAVAELWPPEYTGPVFVENVTRTLRVLTDVLGPGAVTIAHLHRFFTDERWRADQVARISDEALRVEAVRETAAWSRASQFDGTMVVWLASKFAAFAQGPAADLFRRPSEDVIDDVIAAGGVVLVTLPVGLLGTEVASLIGRMLGSRLVAAIAAQGSRPAADRRPVSLMVDEAHLLAGDGLAALLAQARKFNGAVTLATQSPGQFGAHLPGMLTNVQTVLAGRLPIGEAVRLRDRIGPDAVELLPRLARHHLLYVPENAEPDRPPIVIEPIAPPQVQAGAADAADERRRILARLDGLLNQRLADELARPSVRPPARRDRQPTWPVQFGDAVTGQRVVRLSRSPARKAES